MTPIQNFVEKCEQFDENSDFAGLLNLAESVMRRTQRELAEMAEVTPISMCQWMEGKRKPHLLVRKSVIALLLKRAKEVE